MYRSAIGLAALALSACAATYAPPKTAARPAVVELPASQADLMRASRRALIALGGQIVSADESSGTISTGLVDRRLQPSQADCGTTMGIDYLKDNRTTTRVAYGVTADANRLTVRAIINGEYKPGDVTQNITLQCVSRGALEDELIAAIRRELGR